MPESPPPVTRTTHLLPFRNLSPADFERLCLWLIRREGYEPVEHLGASGSEGGRDVVAYRDGQRIAFQCKRTKELGPVDAEDEVDKILRLPPEERPAHLIFVTSCDISATTRKRAQRRAGAITCAFWAVTELDERVKRHDDIVREFFGSRPRRPEIPFIVPVEDVPSFTGRQHELERLAELLLQTDASRVCGIVGVAGAGGIGKTALAAHFAERHRDDFPDGVVGMRVDGKSPDRIARDFARSSGVPIDEQDERDASTIMQEVFRHRRALLIFDNADAATIRQVLPGGDCCAVVVTTRDRGLAAALGLPNDATVDLPVLPEEEAVLLLRRLLGDPRIDEEPAAAREIGNLIGHLPLALQIVGATLRFQPWRRLEEYAASLAEERSRLAKLRVAQTDLDVRASFALSLRTLDEDVIDFLACLSVCAADGFSVRGAMAATDCDEPLAHDRLGTLCRFSLLNAIPDDGGRFAFHPLVHLFAAELAEERMLKEAAAERHASFFVEPRRSARMTLQCSPKASRPWIR